MASKTTAYWAEQIAQYEAENPKARGVPSELKEKYKQAFDLEPEGTRTPITWKGREAHLESYGTRTQKPGAEKWKLVYHETRDIKSTTRRAAEQSKQITLKQRQDWYKRNLYPDWKIRAAEDFAKDAKDRADLKSRIRKANKSLPEGEKLIYEHLSPLRVEEGRAGGFESARNVVAAPEGPNIEKSDKVASTKVLRQQQVPVTRSGAIRADARRTPIQGTDVERFGAVLEDIRTQNRPSARALDPIDFVRQRVRFLEGNPMARRSLAVVLPVAMPMLAAMDVEAREKAVQQDPSILNKLQAGLSKVELAGETGSLAGMATAATGVGAVPGAALMAGSEVVSTAAGLANLTIDGVRSAVMFGAHNRIRGRSGAMRATSP